MAVVLLALADLFVTVFNYDGYCLLASRFQRQAWRLVRTASHAWPPRPRETFLSLGSASLLPATVALWLALEITGFALIYAAGRPLGTGYGQSDVGVSSLTVGNVTPRNGGGRAGLDLETILGVTTFTLALGYVVTSFGLLQALESLHGQVRRHASDPARPSSILARHFRGGSPDELPSLLQALGEDLDAYDQGLRRYPVVYYFHTRRRDRAIPHVFTTLGDLISLARWGLASSEPMTKDPFLVALSDGYGETLERLRESFAGPEPIRLPEPLPRAEFEAQAARDAPDRYVRAFRTLVARAAEASGKAGGGDLYDRYAEWLPFAAKQWAVLDRVADTLAYERPSPRGREPAL